MTAANPLKTFWLCAALALAACSPQGSSEATPAPVAATPATHPESGLDVIDLTISQDGREHHFRVEVARTNQQWQRGLMFRDTMGPDEGMIFVGRPGREESFWMSNTVIPLDIIFIGTDDRILNYYPMTTPYSLESLPSRGLTNAVLEINGGRLEELGFGEGAKVEWDD